MANRKKKKSGSNAQINAERKMVFSYSNRKNIKELDKKTFNFDEIRIEVDGYSEESGIACEAWAHIGKPKAAQKAKIMKDAAKLLFLEKKLKRKLTKALLFCDHDAFDYFNFRNSSNWMAACLNEWGFELEYIELQDDILKSLKKLQKKQSEAMRKINS